MKIIKLLSTGLAGNVALHGAANAHVLDHIHTHSEHLTGFVLIAIGFVSLWLMAKGRKG